MDMGKPNARLAAEATLAAKTRRIVVATGYKRAAGSRRSWRTSTSPAGALQVAVWPRSPRARSCFNGRICLTAASDDRRETGAYSIAFPIDKVLAQFPRKIMVKPGESYS
jgi:hypothetical protein